MATAIGHYLWPPRWVGDPPRWADPAHWMERLPVELTDMSAVMAESDLPDGLAVRAYRDGMVAYNFEAWGDVSLGLDTDFHENVEALAPRAQLINAHLACLQAQGLPPLRYAVATPWRIMHIAYETGDFVGMSGTSDGSSLVFLNLARREVPTNLGEWRYARMDRPVTVEEMERSFTLLRALLERPDKDATLLRASMLLRSGTGLLDGDYGGGLTYAWTAIESMLGDMMRRYLSDCSSRPTGDSERTFMNAKRRAFLEGADTTAAHIAEFLSLADRLPFELYELVGECRKLRNAWLHSTKHPTYDEAWRALFTARLLFAEAEGVDLEDGVA